MILSLKMLFIYVAFSIVNIKHEGTYLECVLKSKFTFLIVNIKHIKRFKNEVANYLFTFLIVNIKLRL